MKRKITIIVNKLRSSKEADILTNTLFLGSKYKIRLLLKDIEVFDTNIIETYNEIEYEIYNPSVYRSEIDKQANYTFEPEVLSDEFAAFSSDPNKNSGKLLDSSELTPQEAKPPNLQCGLFEGNEKNELDFSTLLNQFENVIGSRKNMIYSTKLPN